MTNLELAKEQGSQAAPNVIDAVKAGEVQIDVTLAQEQGNQATPLIADSLASSESYDAIKQQGNQAMPLIIDALVGGGSDTGFSLVDFTEPGNIGYHVPMFVPASPGVYSLTYYGILRDGHNLPNFTKLSVDNTDYDIHPIPSQEPPSATGCYLVKSQQIPIDSQEMIDMIKAVVGFDVKIGDTMVIMELVLLTEQVLSGDVPFTLYADQDSWYGTLHEYVDTSAEVYTGIGPNTNSTAYEISVYTENASNPYYKIGDDGEWTAYDSNNKPELYLPGNYTIYLKAESDYDGSEISNDTQLQIAANFTTPDSHIVENPSAMFAGLDFRVHLQANYGSELTGRDDVVLLYKDTAAANWSSAAMTSTSAGYFAEIETGWGHKAIEYKVQIDGVSSNVPDYFEFDAVPMTPSFVDIINDNDTYFARLRFGANYPDMNTVETIEYSFDNETWVDARHDATSGYELAEMQGQIIYFRTKLVSDLTIKSAIVSHFFDDGIPDQVVLNACTDIDGNVYSAAIIGNQVWLAENLKTTKYADGTEIPFRTGDNHNIPVREYPGDSADNVAKYGYLYSWHAVVGDDVNGSSANPSNIQGVAPTGWHIPSFAELQQLKQYLEYNPLYNLGNYSGYESTAKSIASTTGWLSESGNEKAVGYNQQQNNAAGLNVYPAGSCSGGLVDNRPDALGHYSYIASATLNEENRWLTFYISYGNWYIADDYDQPRDTLMTVRCIYDGTPEEFLASLAQQQSSTDRE